MAKNLNGTIAEKDNLVMIPVVKIGPHPDNPRKDLGDLTELADSIKANGILQNLTVVQRYGEITGEPVEGNYTVVIGHRRLAAAKMAGLEEVPCVVRDMPLSEQIRTMLMENIQRADLSMYEQAQGFQMMLNMGDTVEDIARKSGFSQTTVRRRVKLLELDPDKFKQSSERGATLFEYMELDKLKSADRKNDVLEYLGTENFKYKLKQAIEVEKTEEKLAAIEAKVSAFATKVDSDSGYAYVKSWSTYSDTETVTPPADADTVPYFYFITNYNAIRLLKEQDAADSDMDERVAREKAKREREEARRKALTDATARAHELRAEFAKTVSNTTAKKHIVEILAAWAHSEFWENTCRYDSDDVPEAIGTSAIEQEDGGVIFTVQMAMEAISQSPERALWNMVYLVLGDSAANGYKNWDGTHRENEGLDTIYDLLCCLGYEMSDDEKALRDGTHELFQEESEDVES